jgi:molecular chaperone DnaK (HSP70)
VRQDAERSDALSGVLNGAVCDHCGWELRESDHYCSLCGRQQRRLTVEPDALSLLSPRDPGDDTGPETFSPGRVRLSNDGKHSFRLLAVEAPQGIDIDPVLPLGSEGGRELPVQGTFDLEGKRSGELGAEPMSISIRTSVGTLRLPVRTKAAPPLRLSQRDFQVPRGQEMEMDCELSLAQGAEWIRLEVRGPGLELVEPRQRFRLQAGVPRTVTLRADAARCVRPQEPCEPCGLVLQLDDGARLVFPLTFEEATPGRLLLVGGERYFSVRVFPGESVRRVITLRNDGRLSYPIETVSLTIDAGKEFPGVRYRLFSHLGQPLSPPYAYEVPPGETIQVYIDCAGGTPPGVKLAGTLQMGAPDVESFLLPFLLDAREPRPHRLPAALDFGTSASAVATRHQEQRRPGQVLSIEFRPPDEERSDTLLPSDVQIVRHPESGEPSYEIDWGKFTEERHLGLARNLKRRIGLPPDHPESTEIVVLGGRLIEIPVEELAAFVIREMKRQTEQQLGERLTRVVATFPTRFSLRRVQALREVYRQAGLPDIALIDEAVAAGILGMYNEFKDKPEYTLLVYDMGGGTTDVTLFHVVNHRAGNFLEIRPTVLGVGGDIKLGGRDVTEMMMQRVLDNLPSDEREAIPWPGRGLEAPELQKIAKRNQNHLFIEIEKVKLKLFPMVSEPVPVISATFDTSLWNREGKLVPLKSTSFTSTEVEEAFQPRLERLWVEILDMLKSSGVDPLDFLYLAGRSSLFPPVRFGLERWLSKEGGFPRLQRMFAQTRNREAALKEAVSLGASLALDLIEGGGNEKLAVRGDRSGSRFGIRSHRGEFLEILPTNWEIDRPSDIRQPVWLGTPYRSDLYEARLEVWENPTHNPRVDDNPEAELVGIGHLTYPAEEIGPSEPLTEVGLVLTGNRTLRLQAWRNGEVKEVPVEP